jgi:hypothetical protein
MACFLCGTRVFITVFTKAHHWTLTWTSQIWFALSIHISLNSILILYFHLRIGLPSDLFPFGPPNQNAMTPFPHVCCKSYLPHPHWFNHCNNIIWIIQVMKLIITQFSAWYISSLLCPNILLNTALKNSRSMFLLQSDRPSFVLIE